MNKKMNKKYKKEKNLKIIIPDLVLKKESTSCGDYLTLMGQVDKDIVSLKYISEKACSFTEEVCDYLQNNFSDIKIVDLKNKLEKLYSDCKNNPKVLFDMFGKDIHFYSHRYECMIAPIRMTMMFIDELDKMEISNYVAKKGTISSLECDACVGSSKINWGLMKETKENANDKFYPAEYVKKWLPYARINLPDDERKDLGIVCNDILEEELQFLSDRTINTFIMKNALKDKEVRLDKRWKAAAYLIQKNEITRPKMDIIKDFIIENKLNIYFVKGYVTQRYYENPNVRIHSDYDLISCSSKDAFKLAHYLLNDGFKIRQHLFSYKKMLTEKGTIVTGHFHMQKIIDDLYMLEIDISFPGFPINRVDMFFPRYNNAYITTEDQIIITLLHLFKHSHIFMKDLNDLFLMLSNEDVDVKYLKQTLKHYKIKEYFDLAFTYIYHDLQKENDKFKRYLLNLEINEEIIDEYSGWPYDEKKHLEIKRKDYEKRIIESPEFERVFLSPVVMFKNLINVSDLKLEFSEKINESIYTLDYTNYRLYVTCFGIFINNNVDTASVNRRDIIYEIESILKKCDIIEILDIPYATESFYVRTI